MNIIHADSPEHIAAVRILFREYESFLNLDLCFQDFENELAGLPGKYAPPQGALLLAVKGTDICGCVALRELEPAVCEMKRLFVRPKYRGIGLGGDLAKRIIAEAQVKEYAAMRLDTLAQLAEAIRLYERLGFRKTAPYYHNPLPGASYWELDLKATACEKGANSTTTKSCA
ncbi:MAG: GNAT family N-acetyltransferase [Deltaproteobacteria bacterium]|nr:GNAT family N-acetyltransferase [Deltaproteobacteria bacterium]